MANISRYNPANDALDDLFRGFFLRPVRFEGEQDVQIRVDISEDDKAYTVHAEIPGVRKDDIHVTVDGGNACHNGRGQERKGSGGRRQSAAQ